MINNAVRLTESDNINALPDGYRVLANAITTQGTPPPDRGNGLLWTFHFDGIRYCQLYFEVTYMNFQIRFGTNTDGSNITWDAWKKIALS